jgi:hypothetical protein
VARENAPREKERSMTTIQYAAALLYCDQQITHSAP